MVEQLVPAYDRGGPATALTAIFFGNTFRFTLPPSLWSLGNIFPSSKHTWGTRKNYSPPPEYKLFDRPCARPWSACAAVAAGGLGCRPHQAWRMILFESPSQTSLEMYHRRRHRVTPGRGASLGARARSEAISLLLARKKCKKMQMKCFLPEPRFPLEPCTVANGAGTAAMRERRQLRLPGAWFNWWRSSSFHRQWVSMRVVSTFTVVVVLPDARHHSQRSGCALRPFKGSSGQYPQNGRVRVLSPAAEAL